ncbi:MAG TPA: CAP domain-containing protein [Acidimicrobiales bacterium]|nr:CAP domain-containing protein [Acidimicrobiales bacterium]
MQETGGATPNRLCIDTPRRPVVFVVALVALLAASGAGAARAASPGDEAGFVARANQERTARGLISLAVADDLRVVARRHAQRMVDRDELYHNPNLGSEVEGWDVVAENVGVGSEIQGIHDAFMASPTHRDVILRPDLEEVGVGVVRTDDGRIWVVEVFRRPSAPPFRAAAASPPVAAQPSTGPPPQPEPSPSPPADSTVPDPGSKAGGALAEEHTPQPTAGLALAEGIVQAGWPGPGGSAGTVVLSAGRALPATPAGGAPLSGIVAALCLALVVGLPGLVLLRLGLVALPRWPERRLVTSRSQRWETARGRRGAPTRA